VGNWVDEICVVRRPTAEVIPAGQHSEAKLIAAINLYEDYPAFYTDGTKATYYNLKENGT
jgi:hypothetical protein